MAELEVGGSKRVFKIKGAKEAKASDSVLGTRFVTVRGEFCPEASRTARHISGEEMEVFEDDILELEFADGHRLWLRTDEFRSRFGREVSRGWDDPSVLGVPSELPMQPQGMAARGLVTWALKSLKVLDLDPREIIAKVLGLSTEKVTAEMLSKPLAEILAAWIDERKSPWRPGVGLWRCRLQTGQFELSPVESMEPSDKPVLVFIPGTGSSTFGSFGDLWSTERRQELARLLEKYGDNVFAFEHHSLTRSPITNSLDFLEKSKFPKGARVHLVTHSRGGLVGELLCRGAVINGSRPFSDDELDLIVDESTRTALEALSRALQEKAISVERFVRVACPALGTTFASRRLDRWLSVMGSLGSIALEATPFGDFMDSIGGFVAAVVKERTNPSSLPGLEAMMPESNFIKVVNWPKVTVSGELAVIAGDIDPDAWWARLLVWATDRFYESDHDLVVNTPSMVGGVKRSGRAIVSFHKGPEVNHFNYFRNEASAQHLVDALTSEDGELQGFEPLRKPTVDIARAIAVRSAEPRPVVFVLPGIMGSELKAGGNYVWLDIPYLMFGAFEKLRIGAKDVEPFQPFPLCYGDLISHLSQTHKVVPFPFDWRLEVEREADRLAVQLRGEFDAVKGHNLPVRILAHSMGGLLARAMIAHHGPLWQEICAVSGSRLVMLGTPNGGSYAINELLVGRSSTLRKLALLDLKHDHKELLEIISRFPGVLAMLPKDSREDYFSYQTWKDYHEKAGDGWVLPAENDLKQARDLRRLIDNSPLDPRFMAYVAGCARETIACMTLDMEEQEPEDRIKFQATGRGDGRVTWDSGIPPEIPAWYMEDVGHGDLPAHEKAFEALVDLLQQGTTTKLPQTPPLSRAAGELFAMPRAADELYPDAEGLAASALGASPRRRRPPREREGPVKVRVVHGNLAFASHPVAVGHYFGDGILSAEAHLDGALDGALSRRYQLGSYPGETETSAIFINSKLAENPNASPKGAVIVGLGTVGNLTAASLTRTFTRALLEYVIEWCECGGHFARRASGDETQDLKVSALLIGSGSGGIPVSDSIFALLEGVRAANHALQTGRNSRRISEVEFIELWEDQAIQAVNSLKSVWSHLSIRDVIEFDGTLESRSGGLRRVSIQESPGWWQRLQILEESKDGEIGGGTLRFTASTRRARSEVRLLPTQRALVDQFVEQSIRSTADNQGAAHTLFELLLPNEIKKQAPGQDDVVLILDEAAARYPWELLRDPLRQTGKPFSVEHGLLRQLESKEFRETVQGAIEPAVLVIGDPVSKFPELKGAQAEAEAVWRLLQTDGRFQVEKRIRPDSRQVMNALFARTYRILHLAGHGIYRYVPDEAKECESCGQTLPEQMLAKRPVWREPVTGMIIGDGVVLSPKEVRQMRFVPELVFVNCCHLGAIEPGGSEDKAERNEHNKFNLIAANVATEFIRMGVRAVIAAGWAVDDNAASTFATAFYEQMTGGRTFGDAVRIAREATFYRHPAVNTWGAYQCYGDPDYRLFRDESDNGKVKGEPQFVSRSEVVAELDNFTARMKTWAGKGLEEEIQQLRNIVKVLEKKRWLGGGAICAALGRAFGEAKCFREAIAYLEQALLAEDAQVKVRDMEQLANFECRLAVELNTKGKEQEAMAMIDRGIKRLDAIMGHLIPGSGKATKGGKNVPGHTVERLSLLGSAYKRKAWVGVSGRTRSLEEMCKWYRKAYTFSRDRKPFDPYPLLNWLTAELAVDWQGEADKPAKKRVKDFTDLLTEAESEISLAMATEPDFWKTAMLVDIELIEALSRETLKAKGFDAIAENYLNAKKIGSPREFESVLDQLDFLIAVAGKNRALQEVLSGLRKKLK